MVTVDGVPNRETQVWTKARATVSAVLSMMGTASGQRVKRSTQVSRYVKPFEVGRGPTRSKCTLTKRESGMMKVAVGAVVWRWILERWHRRHVRAYFRTSELILGQTKWCVIRRCVALIPGWVVNQRLVVGNSPELQGTLFRWKRHRGDRHHQTMQVRPT